LSQTYEQHPKLFPCGGTATLDYDPDTADARAERKVTAQAIADYCNDSIDLDSPCECMEAYGFGEDLLPNPSCQVCSGTGRPTRNTLVAGLDGLNDEIDQLSPVAGDICTPAKVFLDLAWWQTEEAIRKVTGSCSMHCKPGGLCGCCHHYGELKSKAERIRRLL
jgi:hypothetical protein